MPVESLSGPLFFLLKYELTRELRIKVQFRSVVSVLLGRIGLIGARD
jgi:hypothetical protein